MIHVVLLAIVIALSVVYPVHADEPANIPPEARRAFFGELHLHTNMSFDAYAAGTRVDPDTAYRFARGEAVRVPRSQLLRQEGTASDSDVMARRAWPLDFAAVTDHSEFLGAMAQLDNPESAFAKTKTGKEMAAGGREVFFKAGMFISTGGRGPWMKALLTFMRLWNRQVGIDLNDASVASDGWTVEKKAANSNYQPGKFTTLIGYEWTASPEGGVHMHRNVIFDGDDAPAPFSALNSDKPEDLWRFLEMARTKGIDVLAIPHNSNLSDGMDFAPAMSDGRPITQDYAKRRAINEPLVEIAQLKGTSETTRLLSPNDEFADFEIMDRIYKGETEPKQDGSYVRQALARGLTYQEKLGANPFKMGIVAASDIHNGLSSSDEAGYGGGSMGRDPQTMPISIEQAKRELDQTGHAAVIRPNGQKENDPLQYASAGVTGVWAEENNRASIFAALKRRETFGTSGSRIRVRMFGGWNFDKQITSSGDWVKSAYALGVPMGGDLSKSADPAQSPAFIVQALKDPDGANLDRIQIIKLWTDGQASHEKIFDVAASDGRELGGGSKLTAVGNTVDLATGAYSNSIGSASLIATWRDPEFDPNHTAAYYARVLEIPTPRWSTVLALQHHLPIPDKVSATIQERAWSSPIWYNPK